MRSPIHGNSRRYNGPNSDARLIAFAPNGASISSERASGSYERQTTTPLPQPLLLTNWCEGEGGTADAAAAAGKPDVRPSVRPFTRSALHRARRRPVRPPFFLLFHFWREAASPRRINNGDDEDGNEI